MFFFFKLVCLETFDTRGVVIAIFRLHIGRGFVSGAYYALTTMINFESIISAYFALPRITLYQYIHNFLL